MNVINSSSYDVVVAGGGYPDAWLPWPQQEKERKP
jgi:hypothetical protein